MSYESEPILYILMRSDLASLNAGKAMAQAAHASNQFVKSIVDDYTGDETAIEKLYNEWVGQTGNGFGTTIVLDIGGLENMLTIRGHLKEDCNLRSCSYGVVHDPTYPVTDGSVTHLLPMDTCSYLFCDKHDLKINAILKNYELYP